MMNDRTRRAMGAADPTGASEPIEAVHEGMTVVDASGHELGQVRAVKLPSHGQATPAGSEDLAGGARFSAAVSRSGGPLFTTARDGPVEPSVPEPLRSRLLMHGYVRIGGALPLVKDRYVPADAIAAVTDDVVRLTGGEELAIPEDPSPAG
jgi:hypothetical protein